MKFFILAFALLTSSTSFADTYVGSISTRNLGQLKLVLDLDLTAGKVAEASKAYFREQDDQHWGDWVCLNSVKFSQSLNISAKVFDQSGTLLGLAENNRYDQRKGEITLNQIRRSPEEFRCDLLSFSNTRSVGFGGYDSALKAGDLDLNFKLDGSQTEASIIEKGLNRYQLNGINVSKLISNSRGQIQWSVTKDQGYYSNSFEWGFVDLKRVK